MDNKIRVFFISTDSRVGGAEKNILYLLESLDRTRFEPFICCILSGGDLMERAKKLGVEGACLSSGACGPPAVLKACRLIRSFGPSIIHSFLFHANVLGRIAGRLCGVRKIISSHRVVENRGRYIAAEKLTSWMSDAVTCNCEAVKRHAVEDCGIPASKVRVIPNAVRAGDPPAVDAAALRHELGISGRSPVLCTIARLHPQKGLEYLLEAVKSLADDFPDMVLLLAGEGKQERVLKKIAGAFGISGHVRFLGHRKDPLALMLASDVFVLPSLYEGMPNVVLEAMSAGRPVVATAVGGTPEAVTDGKDGFLVPAADSYALATRLREVLRDPGLLESAGRNAAEKVKKEFSIGAMVAKTEALYAELMG